MGPGGRPGNRTPPAKQRSSTASSGRNGIAAYVTGGVGNEVAKLTAERLGLHLPKGTGPAVETKIYAPGQPVSALLRNSIALDLPEGAEPQRDLVADGGTIEAEHSSFTHQRLRKMAAPPLLPAAARTSPATPVSPNRKRFALAPTSPLIDRGDPSIVESGELDSKGTPRSLDGNRDCIAAPDIGAFEVAGQSAACPPKVADASRSCPASASATRRSPRRAKNRRRRAR